MERAKQTIKLSSCEVDVVEEITWMEAQRIEEVLFSEAKVGANGLDGFDGSAMLKSKIVLLEIGVLEIRVGDKVEKFSEEWLNTLSQADGELLYSTLDGINKKKD